MTTDPGRPIIQLPPELSLLLREREEASAETARLQRLYSPGAILLDAATGTWTTGSGDVAQAIVRRGRHLRLLPLAAEINADAASIAGTAAEMSPEGAIYRDVFVLALSRGPDGHWHITSETTAQQPLRVAAEEINAQMLIRSMDRAGIRRAVVLAAGYWFANRFVVAEAPGEYARVRAENDWAVAQARLFPGRLIVFCGVNPLRSYAVQEVERCKGEPGVRGIKLHFANSGVDLKNPQHVERVRAVFAAADRLNLAIIAHLWVPGGYGAEQSRLFLYDVLPAAPNVVVQIAHLTGTGPGYFPSTDAALGVFVDAIASGDRRMRNVFFDVASNVTNTASPEALVTISRRLRQVGLGRILFGSDAAAVDEDALDKEWRAFLRLPLSQSEFRQIAGNVAPYLR